MRMTVTADVVEEIAHGDLVALPDLVRASGVSGEAFRTAMKEGLITPTPVKIGRGAAYTITKEDAVFLLIVAALAVAAGIAFVTMLRTLRATGAQVSGTSVTITLPGGAK